MITITIKTWKDYKNDFKEWLRRPRQRVCKEYIECVSNAAQRMVNDRLREKFEGKLSDTDLYLITDTAMRAILDAKRDTLTMMNLCQPKGMFEI